MRQRIRIRGIGQALEDFRKTWKALEQGKEVKQQGGTYFTSLEAARRVLTPKRLEILRVTRRERPESLYRLSRLVGRDTKNVQEDVRALAELGLISLRKSRGTTGRPTTVPRVTFKEIEVRIAV